MAKELIPFPEDEQLIVGKFYNVRCAIVEYGDGTTFKKVVPVIGKPHMDKSFSDAPLHIHIDGRFISVAVARYNTDKSGKTNGFVSLVETNRISAKYCGEVIKRLKCKRLTTGIKPPHAAISYWGWYKEQLGKPCAGRKCPHLGTHMLECNGRLVCPLHNLQGDLKTEKIIEAIEL